MRPDPDQLLRAIHQEEKASRRGALRVFLGMSAGVGKTFAMLAAAQTRRQEGVDVVIGIVETHGRRETSTLTESLEVVPKSKIEYKGVSLEEMNLDGILARRPQLVLVDELAHTNAPGSRHAKRYQDVLEILEAGIHVYSTINVQHLESRKDLVEKISGVPIRETVPDSIMELAREIEVIDVTPNELLKRLKEGKIYLGDKAEHAAENFFKLDSLTALREIALRFTAETVDQELQRYRESKDVETAWQTNERLMVAVSHSPYSERLIRATRRLAFNLEAPWIAVHVDVGVKLNDEDQAQLARNISLARELSAEVITTTDVNIPSALRRIARQKNVTQIVVGRPTKRWVMDFIEGGTLLDRLVQESGEVDIHVIRHEKASSYRPKWIPKFDFETGFLPYWNTFWLFFAIALGNEFLMPVIGYRAVGFIFLIGVMAVGMVSRRGPVIFAAALSVIAWNFFFIPPRFTFVISSPGDLMLCLIYFGVALITGTLTTRIRKSEQIIHERDERTSVLYEVLRDISSSREKSEFLTKVIVRIGQVLDGHCGVLSADGNESAKLKRTPEAVSSVYVDDKEMGVAQWAFDHRKAAGWSTDTLSQSSCLFVPLEGDREVVGVFVYQPKSNRKLSLEQENLLFSICKQVGLALERELIEERVLENEKLQQSERLHQTLLNSISHEMRTPLTAILGSVALLEDGKSQDTPGFRQAIATELSVAGDRLNRVIENLLDMSRLNSGALALKKEWHDLHDLIGVTVKRLGRNLDRHSIVLHVPVDLPLVELDFRLFEHALSNLLINAALYTPTGTAITVSARVDADVLRLTVEDSGSGIPSESLARIFDKFYRVPGSPAGGTGLGLSIAKAIVEFHAGKIQVANKTDGGAKFEIELPLGTAPEGPVEST